jgi:hypothetical protein
MCGYWCKHVRRNCLCVRVTCRHEVCQAILLAAASRAAHAAFAAHAWQLQLHDSRDPDWKSGEIALVKLFMNNELIKHLRKCWVPSSLHRKNIEGAPHTPHTRAYACPAVTTVEGHWLSHMWLYNTTTTCVHATPTLHLHTHGTHTTPA